MMWLTLKSKVIVTDSQRASPSSFAVPYYFLVWSTRGFAFGHCEQKCYHEEYNLHLALKGLNVSWLPNIWHANICAELSEKQRMFSLQEKLVTILLQWLETVSKLFWRVLSEIQATTAWLISSVPSERGFMLRLSENFVSYYFYFSNQSYVGPTKYLICW